jgi:methyl-accepting chemotaxis protein
METLPGRYAAERSSSRWRWGLVIVLVTAISGCVLMVIAGSREAVSWLGPAGVLWALICAGCYVMTVALPQRRLQLAILARDRRREAHFASLGSSLEELRHGDLVGAQTPIRELSPEVRHAVEAAARSLAGLVQQIQSSSVEVATAAGIVQETASDLASGSSQQAAAVVQITATMEELARTAGQIAVNAAGQAELAAKSEKAGNDGAAAVEAAVVGVEAVRERMEAIARRADTLGSRSREIYRVLDLIVEISQETHILSLNAAIEAAAAGEHGERFSVVADEVRRLAERSRESTDSVRSLLDEFSGAIRSMVVATEEGSKAAEQVLQRSRSTEMSIEQLS